MELEGIQQKKYEKEILNLIWYFIAEESYKLSKRILPENQIELLADIELYQSDHKVIYDYFFIIDRFCNTRVFPQKYDIKYSTKFNRDKLDIQELENLDLIITTLQSDERKNFEILNKFYPKSSENFLSNPYNSTKNRYIVDFSGSIWGVKHLHLKEKDRSDRLLYYVVIDNNFYFIAIGNHNDMYKKDILEIIINEFQFILSNLGIARYNDMPFNNFDNMSVDDVKRKWIKGENIGFFIEKKFFVSKNVMTNSRIKANLNYEISNITFQINNQAREFIKSILNEKEYNLKIILDEYKDLEKKELLIKEETQKHAQFFYINYLKNFTKIKDLIDTYCS